jgi:hypothetical protein
VGGDVTRQTGTQAFYRRAEHRVATAGVGS